MVSVAWKSASVGRSFADLPEDRCTHSDVLHSEAKERMLDGLAQARLPAEIKVTITLSGRAGRRVHVESRDQRTMGSDRWRYARVCAGMSERTSTVRPQRC